MVKWIFEDDEHFLRAIGVEPWPEADEYKKLTGVSILTNELDYNDNPYADAELEDNLFLDPPSWTDDEDDADYSE